jgi:uncharacterized membrane protein
MVKVLVAASIAWPLLLGGALWHRTAHGLSAWTGVAYVAASRICHQRPERSFHTAGVQWPVCGRCSGLYLGAPLGAMAALWLGRRRGSRGLGALMLASVPTIATLILEWTGVVQVTSGLRAVAAVPLGALIAYVIVRGVQGTPRAMEYTLRP